MNQLYLVRHGQSQANCDRLMSGSLSFDCPLSDLGLSQAEELGRKLKDVPFHYVITSRLARAKHTAEAILWHNLFVPEVRVENAAFDERSMGVTEGRPRSEIMAKYGYNTYSSWDNQLHAAPAGGETNFQLNQRVVPFFVEHVRPLLANNNVLLVTHCQVMRCIVGHLEGIPLSEQLDIGFKNCEVVQYDFS